MRKDPFKPLVEKKIKELQDNLIKVIDISENNAKLALKIQGAIEVLQDIITIKEEK